MLLQDNQKRAYWYFTDTNLAPGEKGPTAFLGEGMSGKVEIAIDQETKEAFAVKRIQCYERIREEKLNQAREEISILARLGNNAQIIEGVSTTPGMATFYILEPYVPGIELIKYFDVLSKKSQALSEVDDVNTRFQMECQLLNEFVDCFVASLMATQDMHAMTVLHKDLHAGNIMYVPEARRATIIDFGKSEVLESSTQVSDQFKTDIEGLGITFYYDGNYEDLVAPIQNMPWIVDRLRKLCENLRESATPEALSTATTELKTIGDNIRFYASHPNLYKKVSELNPTTLDLPNVEEDSENHHKEQQNRPNAVLTQADLLTKENTKKVMPDTSEPKQQKQSEEPKKPKPF